MIRVEERRLVLQEYQYLRGTTGWCMIDDDTVRKGLTSDLFSVCAFYDNQLVGMGRVVGDGAIYFYVQDIVVVPEYQGKGIGKRIMNAVEAYLKKHAKPNTFVGLMAAEGMQGFYTRFGYLERPLNAPGMCKRVK